VKSDEQAILHLSIPRSPVVATAENREAYTLRLKSRLPLLQDCDLTKTPHAVLVVNQNLVFCTDAVYPCRKRGWRAQRAGFAKTCTDGESVRADRRLRADDGPIRTQATVLEEPVFLILQ